MDGVLDLIPLNNGQFFPVLRNLWEFFGSKGNKVVFVSVGVSESPMVELHFSENIGCPLHLFDQDSKKLDQWNEVKEILKTRKTNDSTSAFAKESVKKWVLPHNIHTHSEALTFSSLKGVFSEISKSTGEDRIDVLKLDCDTTTLASTLYATLHSGYRPGLIFIHWNPSPDSSLETTLLAGHLQNVGYGLICKWESNYLYFYTDKNLYEMCSWEETNVPNPLIAKILESISVKKETKE